MIKVITLSIFFWMSIPYSNAQGIRFETNLTWQQVLLKAKTENKYIFVDCFASWCAPCKDMDESVFSQREVGIFFENNFISLKLQFDSPEKVGQMSQPGRQTVMDFERLYEVNIFPTYLFFNPNGKLVTKEMGATTRYSTFLSRVSSILDSTQQYYTLRERYNAGDTSKALIRILVPEAIRLNDWKTAYSAHNRFVEMMDIPYSKNQLKSMYSSVSSTKDAGFLILNTNGGEINKLVGEPGRTESIFKVILQREIIDSFLTNTSNVPNWRLIITFAKKHASIVADQVVLQTQSYYAKAQRKYNLFAQLRLKYYNKYASAFDHNELFFMNNELMEIFTFCTDKRLLIKAAKWSKSTIYLIPGEEIPTNMDTYANLLYKAGERKKALYWQQRAVEAVTKDLQTPSVIIEEIELNLKKMRSGQPTWAMVDK
jgi:thiol-disulfide isomerase/thioredoxin